VRRRHDSKCYKGREWDAAGGRGSAQEPEVCVVSSKYDSYCGRRSILAWLEVSDSFERVSA